MRLRAKTPPPPKRLRLRAKTPPPPTPPRAPPPAQATIVGLFDWEAEEQEGARKQAYLVTLPHPRREFAEDGTRLVAPGSITKAAVLQCFLKACAQPEFTNPHAPRMRTSANVVQTGVWREFHAETEGAVHHEHDHLPVLAKPYFYFMPVKKALLHQSGLASHWSCSHDAVWSAYRYLVYPTPRKPRASLDQNPALWAAVGLHPPVDDCCHEPLTANALRARRVVAQKAASEKGDKEPRVTEVDVYPIVVHNGFQNTTDDNTAHLQLIAFAKQRCSRAMQAWLFQNHAQLPSLIDKIWRWENVNFDLEQSRRTRVDAMYAAANTECICHGEWLALVVPAFATNGLDIKMICRDVMHLLHAGRGEQTPVLVLAGGRGGEGQRLLRKHPE